MDHSQITDQLGRGILKSEITVLSNTLPGQ